MYALWSIGSRSGSSGMVIKKHPFNQKQASYHEYLRRWKATGEGLEDSCCKAHRGVETAPFIHFEDFLRHENRLMENEFFMDGLRAEGKTRGGALPGLVKQQRDLRALLLIEEEASTSAEKFSEHVKRAKAEKQGPTGVRVTDDDDGMVAI